MTDDDILALSPAVLVEALKGPATQTARILSVLAKAGVPEAQANYGQMLLDGYGVAQDRKRGFDQFRRAAAQGHAMAVNMVGRCYENGWGVIKDATQAALWFRKAAQLGLDWGMYNYGSALAMGSGVQQNRAEAFKWLTRAAALGHGKSHNLVGGFYEDGWEVRPDLAKAREHYRIAAEAGDFRGQFNLGRLRLQEGDETGALRLFQQAAQTATPAFKSKMAAFLSGRPDMLKTLG